jgi:hypothetical protein
MLLVVVLTMIVALTIGLSIASRTVTNLKISRQNEESERAFQAAEAGVAQVLQTGSAINYPNLSNDATYSTKVIHPGNTSFILNGGELVDQDSGLDVWLANYPDFNSGSMTGTISIYWGTDNHTLCTAPTQGQSPLSVRPALEVAILSGNKLDPVLTKYIYDACPSRITSATTPGNFNAVPAGSTIRFRYVATFSVNLGLIMKVIPIFNSSKIFIVSESSGVNFPEQGTIVESTGTSGDTVRKIQYFSSHPQIPPEMFPYSLITQ